MKTQVKHENFFNEYGWIMLSSIGAFVIPYLISFLVFLFFGLKAIPSGTEHLSHCGQSFYAAIEQKPALIIGFILALSITLILSARQHYKTEKALIKELDSKIDHFLKKTKIVFESGINEFDDNHLLAFSKILKALEIIKEPVEIYAIDNTDPRTWWSDTMTGYLALLAKWKSLDTEAKRREVSRVFVCKRNELLSPVFVKTISLHSLIGFKTYIIDLETYDTFYSEYTSTKEIPATKKFDKEVMIWTKTEGEMVVPIELSFTLDKLGNPKEWKKVKCYQSFWKVGEDYNKRIEWANKSNCYDIMNYYGQIIKSKTIDIWFEFISKDDTCTCSATPCLKCSNWNDIPTHYIAFIKELINKTECCHDSSKVKKMPASKLGIEIKSNSISDFISTNDIKDILNEYYSKLTK